MLSSILNGAMIRAWNVEDRNADYRCPQCNNPVKLKRGSRKIPHFAHVAKGNCSYGEGVTEDHLIVQKEICEILDQNNIPCEVEYRGVNGRRADVFAKLNGNGIVFEIQHSRIEPQTILERNQDYARAGYSVIWIMTPLYFAKFGGSYQTSKIRLSSWQEYLLELYGVLYVWNKGKLYAYDLTHAWGQEMVFEYGEYVGDNDVLLKDSFDKIGVAEIDLMFGLQNTLKEFKSDLHPSVSLFGLRPDDNFPADWRSPRKDLEWNDPLR